jgi:hypothetical protein
LIESVVAPDGRHKAQHYNRAEHEDAERDRRLAIGRRVHRSENRFTNVSPFVSGGGWPWPAGAGSEIIPITPVKPLAATAPLDPPTNSAAEQGSRQRER